MKGGMTTFMQPITPHHNHQALNHHIIQPPVMRTLPDNVPEYREQTQISPKAGTTTQTQPISRRTNTIVPKSLMNLRGGITSSDAEDFCPPGGRHPAPTPPLPHRR